MSTLQTFTQRTVAPSGAPAQNYLDVQYSPEAFGASIGRALQNAGQDFQQTGEFIQQKDKEKKAADALAIKAKADDAVRQVLFAPDTGAYAQLGGNAMGISSKTTAQLDKIKKDYIDSVADPETRNVLTKLWNSDISQTKDTVARHELNQLGAYKEDTLKATQLGAINDAYNYYNNEEMQNQSINVLTKAIDANMFGAPPKDIENKKREAISAVRLSAISRMVQEDPNAAYEYSQKHKDELWGKDAVTAGTLVSVAKEDHEARSVVAQITGSGFTANQLFTAMEGAESTGSNQAVSKMGALGIMQVMPNTAREQALRLGMPEVANLSDEELKAKLTANTPESQQLNQALGRSYMQQMLDRYDGDIEAALVAYNAGPKWGDAFVQANIGKAPGQRDYNIEGNPKLESETKPYVNKILGSAGIATGGVVPGARMTADNWTLKNFKPEDLVAPTAGGNWVDSTAAQGLDAVANQFYRMFPDTPIRVNEAPDASGKTAGRRRGTADPADNPHVADSQHLKGRAFDVQVQGWTDEQKKAFLMAARQQGFRGIGFYEESTGHLHIDMGRERTWGKMPEWAKGAMAVPVKDLPSEPTIYQFTKGPEGIPRGDEDTVSAAAAANIPSSGVNAFASRKTPDLAAWQQQANLITDPSKRERVLALLNNEAALRQAEVTKQQEAVKQQAWQITLADDVSAIPMTMRAQLTPEFINGLYAYKKNAAANNFPNNDAAWYEVSTMPPEELAKRDLLTEYRPKLDNEHWDKAVALQREAQAKMDGRQYDSGLMANQRSRAQIVSDIADIQGWTGSKKGVAAQFNIRFGELIDAASANLPPGGRLSEQEMQDIADKLLISDQNKYSWQSNNQAYNTKDPNAFIAARSWDEVQPDDQNTLVNAYRKRWGQEPNQEEAVTLYNSAMQVWLGGKPDINDDIAVHLKDRLKVYLRRDVTDEELTNAYGKYLLELLGRPGAGR